MKLDPILDRQPEADLPPAVLASLSLGLFLSTGAIFAAGVGAILGHRLLDNAFGWGQDILIGAIAGVIVGVVLAIGLVTTVAARLMAHTGQ